jgi:hypothetical protein
MLRKALNSNIALSLFTSQRRSFTSGSNIHETFHQANIDFYVKLRIQGLRTPVCPAYLKSREFLFAAKKKGQPDIDTPAGDNSYLTREELTKYPMPQDFLLKDDGLGLIEAIKRFPDGETPSPSNDSTSNSSTSATPSITRRF